MSLRGFHALLILLSAALAVLFGIWCLRLYGRGDGAANLVAAVGAFAVSVGLLVQELLSRHQIRLDEKRVSQRIEELAAPYEKPDEAAQFYRSNRGMMAQVEATVLEDQVADFVLERAQSKEQARTFQQFMGA